MLGPGDLVPNATVWTGALDEPQPIASAIAGDGLALLCFYPFDWSPTCSNELRLLKERGTDLAAAGIRAFGISLDSPWSNRAFAESLGVADVVTMLSDRLGEAAQGFGVMNESNGLPKADRSAFLVRGDTVVASWMLGSELPDVDAVIAAASSSSG
jgi:peroxiredoxin